MEVRANAKLNLTLDVLGKRPDGYHDLRMIMQYLPLRHMGRRSHRWSRKNWRRSLSVRRRWKKACRMPKRERMRS